jgi:hypothetical protein
MLPRMMAATSAPNDDDARWSWPATVGTSPPPAEAWPIVIPPCVPPPWVRWHASES